MGIGFFMSWIITLSSALALVICVRELVAVASEVMGNFRRLSFESRFSIGPHFRHVAIMGSLGVVAAMGTVFGLLTLV